MKEKKYILFDFDGVIVNSLDLAFSINKQDKDVGYTLNDYLQLFRGNIFSHFKKQDVPQKTSAPNFHVQYEAGMLKLDCVPGMSEVIKSLADSYSLIIISSTKEYIIKKFLEKHNLLGCFVAILGPETEKDKTKKIQMVFENYQTNASSCLFVTDTLGDVVEATKAGVNSIGVTWGYHSREVIEEGSPYALVNTPQELKDLIVKSLC